MEANGPRITARDLEGVVGLVATHKSRQTGRQVSVYDGKLSGDDIEGGRWQTVCEDHATIISHFTRQLAIWHSADPLGWCEECMKEKETGEAQ